MRQKAIDLDIGSIQVQIGFCRARPSECWWRPRRYQAGPSSRRQEIAGSVQRLSVKLNIYFFVFREESRNLWSVFYTPAANCFSSDARLEPLPKAPRSDFMTQSLILSIDVFRGLEMSPLRTTRCAECFPGRSCPNIHTPIQEFCFLGHVQSYIHFFKLARNVAAPHYTFRRVFSRPIMPQHTPIEEGLFLIMFQCVICLVCFFEISCSQSRTLLKCYGGYVWSFFMATSCSHSHFKI